MHHSAVTQTIQELLGSKFDSGFLSRVRYTTLYQAGLVRAVYQIIHFRS